MTPIETCSLEALPGPPAMNTFKRRLRLAGAPAKTVVWGDDLSAQFACGAGTLLVTNYDYFEGVHHWVYLIDPHGEIADLATLPDYFGFMQDIAVISPTEISCSFYGTHDRWFITVAERPRWSFLPGDIARRLNRFFLRKRLLALRCEPGPPWSVPAGHPPASAAAAGSA